MKRVLLTGLTGKSGADLVRRLQQRDAAIPYMLRVTVRTQAQADWIRSALPLAEICIGDLNDPQYIDRVMKHVDLVFHIAGIGWSVPLTAAACKYGVRRMVLVHTTGIYSKYKAAGEQYRNIEAQVDAMARQHGIAVTYLRPSMIYGTLTDGNMIQFIKMVDKLNPMPMVNHGMYLLQPVNYQDLGHAYLRILEKLESVVEKEYILSGRDSILLRDMFREIAACLGVKRSFLSVPFPLAYAGAWMLYLATLKKIDYREKVQRLCEDRSYPHDAATRDFGYDPMPFREGLKQEVSAYLNRKSNGS